MFIQSSHHHVFLSSDLSEAEDAPVITNRNDGFVGLSGEEALGIYVWATTSVPDNFIHENYALWPGENSNRSVVDQVSEQTS